MIETRGFTGKLNTDDNDYRIPNGDYVAALNITRDAQGHGQDEVVSNIVGNQGIPILSSTQETIIVSGIATTTITFANSALPFLNILIRIYNGPTFTTLSSYATLGHSSINQITAGLYDNRVTVAGISYSYTSTTFSITYNSSSYQNIDVIIQNIRYGTNKVIGNYADRVRNRQYYFTWNSTGLDSIDYYDGNSNLIVNLIANKIDTDYVDVLNFDASYRINHIDIIYRDEGDLLFWTDGLNPPRKLNVETALAGGYGTIISSYLDVAKEPPSNPPYCVYYDNTSITINNLNNKQFKFKYRFVFDDNEKSVTSAQCEVPIPVNYSNQSVATDPTKNNNIFMVLDTGANNVKKIEILGAESLGETWSDFFLIDVLDKSLLNISDNDIISYRFYNNQAYTTIPLQESIQPFDNVPQKAYTQSLPNGNVLDYGAITENYDLLKQESEVVVSYKSSSLLRKTGIVVCSNYGDGQIKIIVGGQFNNGDGVYLWFYQDGGPSVTGLFTTVTANTSGTVQSIYSTIKSYLVGQGYTVLPTVIDSTTSYLLVAKSGVSLTVAFPSYVLTTAAYDVRNADSHLAYDWFSRYSYGIVYFDEKGRTNGVITALSSTFETVAYSENTIPSGAYTLPNIPLNTLKIYNHPPLWASYFEIVRTKNLTKSNFLYWLSYRTYQDDIPNQLGQQYAYISISNLTNYLIDNPSIKTISYEFAPGDRIRFVKLYDGTGGTVQIYNASDNRDYQIIESVTNPTINGIEVPGQVLKILLPSGLGTPFNFGGDTYANYLIELYTPAPSFSENNVYYEFGQRYQIFNAGTVNAYHQGMLQNQYYLLNYPAVFDLINGDSYFRFRKFPREGVMRWKSEAFTGNYPYTLNSLLYSNTNNNGYISPYNNISLSTYTPGAGYTLPQFPSALYINPTKTFTFFITGTIILTPSINLPYLGISVNTYNDPSASSFVSAGFKSQPLVAGQETTITYALQITNLLGHNRLNHILIHDWNTWYYTGSEPLFKGTISSWTFEITANNSITQGIIDPNFSDFYDSAASPNGRSWVFDPNAQQSFIPTLIRFGGEYQPGTTVNNINRFYEEDFDIYDRSRGSIKKMFIEGRNQYIFQEFDVGVVTVLTQIVRDTAGNPLSAQSNKLLNTIVYPYIGQYGIGNVPESFAFGKHAKYFVDNNKGVICRLSTDGITPISILYKVNNFFVEKLQGFKETLNLPAPETGTPTVYGAFDAYTNKYIVALSEISNSTITQQAYTFAFLESRKASEGFESELSFQPENMGALNNLFITFKDGQPWVHNNNIYNNFYGIQYNSYIDVVFNDRPLDRKTFLSIMETANTVWYCPSIQSQLNSYGSTPQECYLVAARFALLEGQYQSAILRDMNSQGGMINGDTMHGNFLVVRFQKDNASNFYYLNTVSLVYNNSPLNLR